MKLMEEVLTALTAHRGLTAPELLEHCPEAEGNSIDMGSAIAQLRQENRIHWNGELREQRQVYVVGPKPAQPVAAGRTPSEREPPSERPVASAPAATYQEEESMTIREQIEAAFRKHGPMTAPQLRKHVKASNLPSLLSQLARHGVLGRLGGGPRATIYGLPDQKVPDDAPPNHIHRRPTKEKATRSAKKPGRKPGAKASLTAPAPHPAAPALNGNGTAQFAINAHGDLGIEKEDARVRLEPAEFEALRTFIDKTKPVWNH